MTRFNMFTDEELDAMEEAFCNEGLKSLVFEVRIESRYRESRKAGKRGRGMTNQEQYELICKKAKKYDRLVDVLDKINAEIDQKQYDFMADKDYDEGIRFGLMLAYQIIDKYRSEDEE